MNMSAESQNIGYFYTAGLHIPAQNQIPFYGNSAQMMGGQYRYNQELDQSGHIYSSQNYYIQPPFQKNPLNQMNMGSNHGLYQHDDNEGNLCRSRGDSINFIPIASANFDDNFYPHIQDQIVCSNFQNDINPYPAPHPHQNLQAISHNQQNYAMDDLNVNPSDMMYPYNNYGPNHPQYPMMQNPHHNNLNYLNSNYQMPATLQNYFMNDISNLPLQQHNPNHYAYQNMQSSLHNLCYDGENTQIAMQEDKLSTFQQGSAFKNVLETPQTKNKKKGVKKGDLLDKDMLKNEYDFYDISYLKSTEKVKRRYTESTECATRKNQTKEEAFSNDENSPSSQPLNVKRTLQTPKKRKSNKTFSEATTNFEQNSDINTPTLKEHSHKKIKIEEKENQVKSSTSAEQSSAAKIPCSEQSIQTPAKGGLLSLPQEKMIEQLKNIMKSLPQAYLPFMHKKQTDSQKIEYLKKNCHISYQSDLNKIRSLLPSNFMEYFDVSVESIYQNSYIMNGILQNMPDEGAKKIGTITKKERREKINKYKAKRDKRSSCRKISYDVRKRVADSRLRVKGRFVTKEQALQMIGDTSSDPNKYTNQELRDLLYKKFGAENGERSKKLSMNMDESLNLISLNNDKNLNESDYDDFEIEMEESSNNAKN